MKRQEEYDTVKQTSLAPPSTKKEAEKQRSGEKLYLSPHLRSMFLIFFHIFERLLGSIFHHFQPSLSCLHDRVIRDLQLVDAELLDEGRIVYLTISSVSVRYLYAY
jgi:hypothetical protein